MTPEERFTHLCADLASEPDAALPGQTRRFGSDALTVHERIFAMLSRGHLVVKLPPARVTACIADGTGAPFSAGKASPMKQWLTVLAEDDATWLTLGREALTFVRADRI